MCLRFAGRALCAPGGGSQVGSGGWRVGSGGSQRPG
jgi:hypothetical protein